ncbi:MAG: hypothetical protein ACOX87_12595 [Chloroflexota bacterium]|jgi:hypothetical protein
MGAGGVIDGQSIDRPVLRNVARGLELAAESLSEGQPVPQEAVELMAMPTMSGWVLQGYRPVILVGDGAEERRTHRMKQRPFQT